MHGLESVGSSLGMVFTLEETVEVQLGRVTWIALQRKPLSGMKAHFCL